MAEDVDRLVGSRGRLRTTPAREMEEMGERL